MLLQSLSYPYFNFAYTGVGKYYHFFAILILIIIMLFQWRQKRLWRFSAERGDSMLKPFSLRDSIFNFMLFAVF